MLKLVKSLFSGSSPTPETASKAPVSQSMLGDFLDSIGDEAKPFAGVASADSYQPMLPARAPTSEHIKTEKIFRDDDEITDRVHESSAPEESSHKSWDLLMGDDE